MYYDLNVVWPARPPIVTSGSSSASKKQSKGKQKEAVNEKSGLDTLNQAERTELAKCVHMAIKRRDTARRWFDLGLANIRLDMQSDIRLLPSIWSCLLAASMSIL